MRRPLHAPDVRPRVWEGGLERPSATQTTIITIIILQLVIVLVLLLLIVLVLLLNSITIITIIDINRIKNNVITMIISVATIIGKTLVRGVSNTVGGRLLGVIRLALLGTPDRNPRSLVNWCFY